MVLDDSHWTMLYKQHPFGLVTFQCGALGDGFRAPRPNVCDDCQLTADAQALPGL